MEWMPAVCLYTVGGACCRACRPCARCPADACHLAACTPRFREGPPPLVDEPLAKAACSGVARGHRGGVVRRARACWDGVEAAPRVRARLPRGVSTGTRIHSLPGTPPILEHAGGRRAPRRRVAAAGITFEYKNAPYLTNLSRVYQWTPTKNVVFAACWPQTYKNIRFGHPLVRVRDSVSSVFYCFC